MALVPTVQTFGTVNWHTVFWYRHTHMTFPPPVSARVYFMKRVEDCRNCVYNVSARWTVKTDGQVYSVCILQFSCFTM